MIDEKKLIADLLHDDGINFEMEFDTSSEESILNGLREFTKKLKEGFVDLINAQPSFGWISAKDRLPTPFESVLLNIPCDSPFPTVHEGYFNGADVWMSLYGEAYTMEEVPFWMPMPEPPKDGEP